MVLNYIANLFLTSLLSQWYIGAYIKIANPSEGSSISSGGYSAVAFIYVFAVGFCFSYAGKRLTQIDM